MNDESDLLRRLPKLLRLREADGTITTVRTADATPEELWRHDTQAQEDSKSRIAIGKEMVRLARAEIAGEVPAGTVAQYAMEKESILMEFMLLYDEED